MTYRDSATQLNTTPAATNTSGEQTYIERGQPQVSNLLEELPGVELQRFSLGGGPGANTVAALRGEDPAETHVSAQNVFNHDAYRTFGIYNYGVGTARTRRRNIRLDALLYAATPNHASTDPRDRQREPVT